jgi:hypothetical protein
MTEEKEILEELKNGKIFVDTDDIVIQAIQLTQSKIISIIDKRIDELKRLEGCAKRRKNKNLSKILLDTYVIKRLELESLKKEVLKNERDIQEI